MSKLMDAIKTAQFLANATNRAQAVVPYVQDNVVEYCIAEMVSKNYVGVIWRRPDSDPSVRFSARERMAAEMDAWPLEG